MKTWQHSIFYVGNYLSILCTISRNIFRIGYMKKEQLVKLRYVDILMTTHFHFLSNSTNFHFIVQKGRESAVLQR